MARSSAWIRSSKNETTPEERDEIARAHLAVYERAVAVAAARPVGVVS